MADSIQQQKQLFAQREWLLYFNTFLFEQGLITETERNHMIMKIEHHKTGSPHRKEHKTNFFI